MMITRVWHGRVKKKDADRYLAYVRETGLAAYRSTPGNIAARILRKFEGDICHFYTVSEWENLEAIKAFAGEDFEQAHYYPADKEYLLEFEQQVEHFETFY